MKPIIVLCSIVFFISISQISLAQSVSFSYDGAGNRISRTYEEEGGGLKSLLMSDSLEIVEEEIENLISEKTRIFPNPTTGVITIDFVSEDEDVFHISVTNLNGYQLINKRIFEGENELDISMYPPGTYMIIIYSEQVSSKWIIQKI